MVVVSTIVHVSLGTGKSLRLRAAKDALLSVGAEGLPRQFSIVAATALVSSWTGAGVATPQARLRVGDCDVLLVGTVPGFVPDGDRVAQAFQAFLPDAVALGVPPEDLQTLAALAGADPKPVLPEPDEATARLLELIAPFGGTAVPSPDLERATMLARERGVPVAALDLDDVAHAQLYTKHVKFRHVVQSNSVKRRLLKDGVQGADAYAVAAAWDAAWTRPKGLRAVEAAREQTMAHRLREVAAGRERLLAVVPAVRLDAVVRLVRGAGADSLPPGVGVVPRTSRQG